MFWTTNRMRDMDDGRVLVNASYLHVHNGAAAELVSFDELAQLCEHQVYTSYINFLYSQHHWWSPGKQTTRKNNPHKKRPCVIDM